MNAVNISKAPLAFSILTAVISPTRAGIIPKVDFAPSFAPSKKVSNKGTLRTRPKTKIKPITQGIRSVSYTHLDQNRQRAAAGANRGNRYFRLGSELSGAYELGIRLLRHCAGNDRCGDFFLSVFFFALLGRAGKAQRQGF